MAISGDRRHLATDVQIAGENAVRYGDALMRRVGVPESVHARLECLDRLYAAISAQHAVTRADIAAVAPVRDIALDVALVYFPVGVAFLFASLRLCRRLFRCLPPAGEQWTIVVSAVWMGLVASAAATLVAYLHSWNVDSVRLRDFHMSFRVGYLPIGRHPWLSFLAAFTVFAVASWYEYHAARMRPAEQVRGHSFLGWQH
jgi:hypothetical protein